MIAVAVGHFELKWDVIAVNEGRVAGLKWRVEADVRSISADS